MRPGQDMKPGKMSRLALILSMAVALPCMAMAQSRDHTWSPDAPNMGDGPSLPSYTPVPPVVTPPQRTPVEKSGSASYQRNGDYSFTVPDYTVITFIVDGAGGSAARPETPIADNPVRYAPDFGTPGNDGSGTTLPGLAMSGAGGGGGNGVTAIYRGGCFPRCTVPYPYSTIGNDSVTMTFYKGADGTASGGDSNTTGGAGNGGAPTEAGGRNGGGSGGRAVRTLARGQAGAPVPGQVLTLHVGAGGEAAVVTEPMRITGIGTKPGNDGAVFVNWKYIAYE